VGTGVWYRVLLCIVDFTGVPSDLSGRLGHQKFQQIITRTHAVSVSITNDRFV
jgi:hypothetical protein